MSEAGELGESSGEAAALPAPAPGERAPHELVLLLAGLAAAACAVAAIAGGAKGWTSPTLGVLFATGVVEAVIAVGLAVRVLLVEEKRLALFVPGVVLTALATGSLAAVYLLSGSI